MTRQKQIAQFYVYIWLRAKDGAFPAGTPYYVGKGFHHRASRERGPANHLRLLMPCETEQAAFDCERLLIRKLGRIDLGTGMLRNRTDGGEGATGRVYKHTPETRAKIGAAHKGRKQPDEMRRKVSIAMHGNTSSLGCKRSQETRGKMSASAKAKPPLSEETRLKMSAAQKNRPPVSEETRQKLSEAAKNITPETRAKISAANTGRRHTHETRAWMSIVAIAREARKKDAANAA
jgi:hypothetical protein